MTALATTGELQERLPFEMDEDELREAQGALEDLSEDARSYGSRAWADVSTAPPTVRNLVLRAAARHMKNYDGYTTSRAGDETVQWTDRGESSGTATFTRDEKQVLAQLSGKVGMGTAPLTAGDMIRRPTIGTVPVEGFKPFPFYASSDGPW